MRREAVMRGVTPGVMVKADTARASETIIMGLGWRLLYLVRS